MPLKGKIEAQIWKQGSSRKQPLLLRTGVCLFSGSHAGLHFKCTVKCVVWVAGGSGRTELCPLSQLGNQGPQLPSWEMKGALASGSLRESAEYWADIRTQKWERFCLCRSQLPQVLARLGSHLWGEQPHSIQLETRAGRVQCQSSQKSKMQCVLRKSAKMWNNHISLLP